MKSRVVTLGISHFQDKFYMLTQSPIKDKICHKNFCHYQSPTFTRNIDPTKDETAPLKDFLPLSFEENKKNLRKASTQMAKEHLLLSR